MSLQYYTKKNSTNKNLFLSLLTWKEYHSVAESNPVIIVPFGSIEQHGPHLPLATDAWLGMKIAESVAEVTNSYVLESFLYGMRSDLYSGGGESFPGTCSLRPETFIMISSDLLEEVILDGFRRFVLLNAHFENAPLLREVSRRITQKYNDVNILFCNWWDIPSRSKILTYFPDDFPGMELEHAGLLETSLMLYCFPELVKEKELFPNEFTIPPGFELYPEKLNDVSKGLGSLAPASRASAIIGEEIFKMVIDGLTTHILSKLGD